MSGRAFFNARNLAKDIIPPEILQLVNKTGKHKRPIIFDGQDSLASDELIWVARRVCAAYFESHRYVCINLTVFAGAAFSIEIPISSIHCRTSSVLSIMHAPCTQKCLDQGLRSQGILAPNEGQPVSENVKTHSTLAHGR